MEIIILEYDFNTGDLFILRFYIQEIENLLFFCVDTEGPGAEVLKELHYKVIKNDVCNIFFKISLGKGHLCAMGGSKENICQVCTTCTNNYKNH